MRVHVRYSLLSCLGGLDVHKGITDLNYNSICCYVNVAVMFSYTFKKSPFVEAINS